MADPINTKLTEDPHTETTRDRSVLLQRQPTSQPDPEMKVLELPTPQPDPFNLQATKRYVFNETGNIMLASTEIGSDEIEQSVRTVFSEVSVFFAAMTRAMSTSINPETKKPYSIYDYEAIEGIVNGSGLFVHVSEEDVTHTISSWGVDVSKDLVEALLGLATGEGELVFAQGLISSIAKRGLQVGGSSSTSDGRVGTIVFVCEYLLGMPIVSALVVYTDAKSQYHSFKVGPCVQGHSKSLQLQMHKDTYLFVTPKFIREYSGDLLSAETDLQYHEFIDYLQDLVEHKPVIVAVETLDGQPAPNSLVAGTTYALVGVFLDKPKDKTQIALKFTGTTTNATMGVNAVESDVVTFTPKGSSTDASPIGLFADGSTSPYATTPASYTVA